MSKEDTIIMDDQSVLNSIHLIRGQRVMIDSDFAALYGVETKRLKEAVRRNAERFPKDFMFELTARELYALRTQFASSKINDRRGGTRHLPMAFTEQGVAMLSSVLNSKTAIQVNIQIIRVFSRIWGMMLAHKDILRQLEKVEQRLGRHDQELILVFEHLKQLVAPPQPARRKIGFRRKDEEDSN